MVKKYRSIDDILNDPELNKLLEISEPKIKSYESQDNDIKELIEIEEWVEKENDGKFPENNKNITERKYYHRLKRMNNNSELLRKLKKYDKLGLLSKNESTTKNDFGILKKEINKNNNFNSLDEILEDNSILFEDNLDDDSKLFNTQKYKRVQFNKAKKIAKRKRVSNFSKYSDIFKEIQKDLQNGKRKLVKFKNYDITPGRFYVLKGQLIYIESEDEPVVKNDKNGIYKDRRVHVIYENGTESNIWKRGLGASLYGRNGRVVTDKENRKVNLENEDVTTGYIYVLKTLSQNPQLKKINPLFKVGVTTKKVEERIKNAENESTYLYAPVKLIEKFKIVNLEPMALETAIHHALKAYQLGIDITLPNGNKIHPEEWFCVELRKIEDIISEIFISLQKNMDN